ncbi:ferrous iron transport protein B [Abyssisolibacter fermentans]|uniref:ferrous iron transport protein B n=1 Tax=Abyssisolibacter fermentans TaxID=1766203 RepID=UPI00082E25F7|nr:ferrous iron transport protein B [Abyssisolibacter fermentans]
MKIVLTGNPNCGKTTLFNALTGARQHIGNWPGVTVEKKEGTLKIKDDDVKVVDLPGIYSMSPYSIEEIIARNYILDENPDVIVNIVDASNIERNLYLTMQLLELNKPVIVALNMMDVAQKRGYKIDEKKLSKALGVPVIPIVATKKTGLDDLKETLYNHMQGKTVINKANIVYSKNIENEINNTIKKLETHNASLSNKYNSRWIAIKVLENDEKVMEALKEQKIDEVSAASDVVIEENDFDSMLAEERYVIINKILSKSVSRPKLEQLTTSDKIDKVLTNRILGIPIFAGLMFLVFYVTFNIGNIFLDKIDIFFNETISGAVRAVLEDLNVAGWLQSLIVDGVIGGVGGVLTFLPNIALLFFFISILESSGYMARVAFIMDKFMRKIGLSGKAFLPMVMGFGCNVPAIMSTRTLENEKDRLLAILINPFMSCGARLPVYVLFTSVFFKENESIVIFSLYILGIIIAILVGLIFKKTLFKGESAPFVMELPPYRIPSVKGVLLNVWEKAKGYIVKAGTVIFAASIIIWFILGYNFSGATEITNSIGASIGKFIAPIFKPLGFGSWQATLSLITGISAKEIVISNMAIVYGLGEGVAEAAIEGNAGVLAVTLKEAFNQVAAYAFMVFVLLYTPCIAVIGTIKKETNSWKWTAFSVIYQFLVAWVVALLVYQVGSLIFL